ncbi:transposable element Tcb2 transposase [Trichonephila clavipes]|nr:transposable element Tcb2 transposase [Trichonephila clavipes]
MCELHPGAQSGYLETVISSRRERPRFCVLHPQAYRNLGMPFFRKESPISDTVVTRDGAPVAWGPRIIDTADTAVATPLVIEVTTDIPLTLTMSGVSYPKEDKGKQISRKTVARHLRGGGLYARRSVVCVPLNRQHRTSRLQWCHEHHNWTEQDWACVLFSDESRFSLSSDCRRQLIWRESGTAYRPENIQEKDRYPTCSIMVWAGIMINGRTRLHVVANGTMTGQRYIDEVLLPHVRLFRGAVGDKFVFMDDNATCHRTLAVQDCLDSEGIQRLVWPARSPDLNPIENVWDALGRQVSGRNYPPTNKNTLIHALTEEWDKLPQQLLDNVVQSMVRRVECCITLHGGLVPY